MWDQTTETNLRQETTISREAAKDLQPTAQAVGRMDQPSLERAKEMPHPPDANGDVLRRLESHGDDLSRPRDIDFTVVFPDENTAQQFANHFRALGYKVSAELTNTAEGFPWDIVVVKHMAASHQEIWSL
jgi:hypothetical protein